MNERIKELAEQAEKYALDNVGKGHYGIEDLIYQFQFADTTMAKFAELIVADYARKTIQGLMSDPAFAQHMDEYYEQKWAHRFD
jgi:hypothetical protein